MEFLSIPLDQITVGPRLREVDPDWVALIAASMAERGQDTPVQVRRAPHGYRLVAGAHRMAALAEAGIPRALATVVEASDDEARLIEIDENLMRRELSELDRASFLAERQALYLKLHPETGHGKAPKGESRQVGDFPLPPRFTAATADRIGLSERTIQRLLSRGRRLAGVRAMLVGTRWASNGAALDALARIEDERDQRSAVAALTRLKNPAASVAEALREIGLAEAKDAATGQLSRLEGAWRQAGAGVQRDFLRDLLRDAPTRELVADLLEAAEDDVADGQTRVLRAIAERGRA